MFIFIKFLVMLHCCVVGTFDVRKLLKKLRSLAKKDGILIFTSINVKTTKNAKYFAYHKRNMKLAKYIGQLKLRLIYKKKSSKWFDWVHIEPDAAKKIALESNWKMERIIRGKNGRYAMLLRAI